MSLLKKTLQQYWGYTSFRPLQEEIITAILQQKDVLALLPTGAGKSLCYQLPALLTKGCCIVVSPLIALMQDQVQALQKKNIPAIALHAGLQQEALTYILEQATEGAYQFLYISPERLQSTLFLSYLQEMDISFVAIDEAHCISQWGHDFRPSYLKIATLRYYFPQIPFLAFTATAPKDIQEDIIHYLRLRNPQFFKQSFLKENIHYHIDYTENKLAATADVLNNEPLTTNIIYCRSRKQTEALTHHLEAQQINALYYHAGMEKAKRQQVQELWMQDTIKTIVATTAFGMGIDKPNVRQVIHYDVPEYLEAYYQEVGRAGRDLQPASAVLLWNHKDLTQLRESTHIKYPEEAFLRKVYQSVCEYLQLAIGSQPDCYFDFDLSDFSQKFKLPTLPTHAALKLLEQEGLWTLTDSVLKPATVCFKVEREVLDSLYQTHPRQGIICITLLRFYSGIFQFPTTIRLSDIASRCKISKTETHLLLEDLNRMNILSYHPLTDKPQLYFQHLRVDSNHLLLDTKRINSLRKRHQQRIEAMIDFITNTTICREKLLVAYFGEAVHVNYSCEHCDVCIKQMPAQYSLSSIRKTILQALEKEPLSLACLKKIHPNFDSHELTELLRHLLDEGKIMRTDEGRFCIAS